MFGQMSLHSVKSIEFVKPRKLSGPGIPGEHWYTTVIVHFDDGDKFELTVHGESERAVALPVRADSSNLERIAQAAKELAFDLEAAVAE